MAFDINDNSPRAQYTATAGQTVFTIPFEFLEDADIKVYQTAAAADPDDTADLLTLTTDYTVAGAGISVGDGTLEVTLNNGATLDDVITIVRDDAIDRYTEFLSNGDLTIASMNRELNRIIMLLQQIEMNQDNRTFMLPRSHQESALSLVIPKPESNKYLAWNNTKDRLINVSDAVPAASVTDAVTVDTIADLRLVTGTVSNEQAFVAGYDTAGDGGGGEFYWNSTSTATDNGGTIIKATATTTGRWVRVYKNIIHVKAFGAALDGVIDDTAYLQAAIDSGASEIIIDGTLRYTSQLTVDARIKIINNGTLFYDGSYNATNPHFAVRTSNVEFTGGIFDGNGDSGSIIQFNVGSDYGRVNNAIFKNIESTDALAGVGGDFAFIVLKGDFAEVHDCTCIDAVHTGTLSNDSYPRAMTITGDYNKVSDFQGLNTNNVIITTGSYNEMTNIIGRDVTDNSIYYGGSNNIIDGLYLENVADEPIVFTGDYNTAKNVFIDNTRLNQSFNSLGFQNALNIELDGLTVAGIPETGSLFKTRVGNTASSGVIRNVVANVKTVYGVMTTDEGTGTFDFINCKITNTKDTGYDDTNFIDVEPESTFRDCTFIIDDAASYTSSGSVFVSGSGGRGLASNVQYIANGGSSFRLNNYSQSRGYIKRSNGINSDVSIAPSDIPVQVLGAEAPTTGNWIVGDIIWNIAPSAGGTIGWVCTTAGTPGTWKTFGAISA